MKLKYFLKKTINIKNSYLLTIIIVMLLVIGGCFSYAVFTVRNEAKGALNIVTGNLFSLIESSDLDEGKNIVIPAGTTTTITLKLTNVNGIDSKVNLYYSTTSSNVELGYLVNGDDSPSMNGVVLGSNGSSNDSKTINIQIKNNDVVDATVTFGTSAGLTNATLVFPQDKLNVNKISNMYISNAYIYDEVNNTTKCITGEEATCQEATCIDNDDSNSCPQGTIIKYKVNDDEEKYFYVLHDDGGTMTLQQRENTISNIAWYANNYNNTQGPLTVLPQLENETLGWTNVENQAYTMGTTNFNNTNSFTGCSSYSSCTINQYTLGIRTVKARMITMQEAVTTGCTQSNGCPDFMHNYLYQSTSYGGSLDDNNQNASGEYSYGYWTMSANSSNSSDAWAVSRSGFMGNDGTANTGCGARAVVVISK